MQKPKLKIVKRSVKHVFNLEETAQLNTEFRQSFANLKSVEAEFDSVKASYKAKTTEAESRMETLNATLQAGFEFREKALVVVMDMKAGTKSFFLETDLKDGELPTNAEPVIVEPVTDADRQQELIEAEARFECKEDINLFPTVGDDSGVMTVGRLAGKWFSALRVKIGTRIITERLDSEQTCSKKRNVQIERTGARFIKWVEENLGREESKGFKNQVELIIAEHGEREE
jgi:hypothetical protein